MKRWSLNKKVYFIIGFLILGSMVISFLGLSKMKEIKTSLDHIVAGPAMRMGNAHELKELFLIQMINEKNLILEDSEERIQLMLKRLSDRDTEIKRLVKEARDISTESGKEDLDEFTSLYSQWFDANKKIQVLIGENKTSEAFALSKTLGREIRLKVEAKLDDIIKRNEGVMASETQEANAEYVTARNYVLAISLVTVFTSLGLAALILRQVGSVIAEVVNTLETGSAEVTSASQMIASSSEELSEAATEQASSLEETSSSIQEMNSMVQRNSESAKRTSELSQNANLSAEKGKTVVKNMILSITDISNSNETIKNQIDESNKRISEIVQVIEEIGNKTKVINDIVFQTKLLSFNASVEAARAGEHGKGFAVVAEEVGNLAQMSGNAAQEISSMLVGSISKVESIVSETQTKVTALVLDGKKKVENGTKIAHECGEVLDEIVKSISSVSQMAGEISTASHEQAQGVQEITKAMNQLDQVTQMNASASEEVASSAEQLSGQAVSLHAAVGILTRIINGDSEQVKVQKIIKNNVISLKKKAVPVKHETASVPSENDPRFEEA